MNNDGWLVGAIVSRCMELSERGFAENTAWLSAKSHAENALWTACWVNAAIALISLFTISQIAENFNTLLHERSPFACLIYAFSGAWYAIYWKAVSPKFRTFKLRIFCYSRLIWQLCVRLLRHSECGGGSHIWKWRAALNLLAWTYYGNGRGQDYNILDEIKNCSSSSSEKQPQFSSTIANHL